MLTSISDARMYLEYTAMIWIDTTDDGQHQIFETQEGIEAFVTGGVHARRRQQRVVEPEPSSQGDGEEQLKEDGS